MPEWTKLSAHENGEKSVTTISLSHYSEMMTLKWKTDSPSCTASKKIINFLLFGGFVFRLPNECVLQECKLQMHFFGFSTFVRASCSFAAAAAAAAETNFTYFNFLISEKSRNVHTEIGRLNERGKVENGVRRAWNVGFLYNKNFEDNSCALCKQKDTQRKVSDSRKQQHNVEKNYIKKI